MPRIFSKNTKFTVIEYGEHCTQNHSWEDLRLVVVQTIKKLLRA